MPLKLIATVFGFAFFLTPLASASAIQNIERYEYCWSDSAEFRIALQECKWIERSSFSAWQAARLPAIFRFTIDEINLLQLRQNIIDFLLVRAAIIKLAPGMVEAVGDHGILR